MKYIYSIALWLTLVPFSIFSQPASLILKDEWGSNYYSDMQLVNGYVYALTGRNKVDILDPTQELLEQRVHQLEVEDLSYVGSTFNIFNNFLVINSNRYLTFYSLSNPTAPEVAHQIKFGNDDYPFYNSVKVLNNTVYVLRNNVLYTINENPEKGIEVTSIETLEGLTYYNDGQNINISRRNLYIENNVLFVVQEEQSENDYHATVIRKYDISQLDNIVLLDTVVIPAENGNYYQYLHVFNNFFIEIYAKSLRVLEVKNGEAHQKSLLDVGAYISRYFFQQGTNQLVLHTNEELVTINLSELFNPVIANREASRLESIYRYIPGDYAIVKEKGHTDISLLDLNKSDSKTSLLNHSGSVKDLVMLDNQVYVLKQNNVHLLDTQSAIFNYKNSFTTLQNQKEFTSLGITDKNLFIESPSSTSVYELNELEAPEYLFSTTAPYQWLQFGVNDAKNKIIASNNYEIYWYDISHPNNVLISPLVLDLSSYLLGESADSTTPKYIDQAFFVNGYAIAITRGHNDEVYIMSLKKDENTIEVVDHIAVGTKLLAGFFSHEKYLYQAVQSDDKLKKIEVSDNGSLIEIETITLSLNTLKETVLNGVFMGDFLITQTPYRLHVYDYSTPELKAISEVTIPSGYANVGKLMKVNGNTLILGNQGHGTVSLYEMNFAPVLDVSLPTISEDTTLIVSELISDPENDEITYAILNPSAKGELVLSDDKLTIHYTPYNNYYGSDQFKVEAKDALGNVTKHNIEVTITPVNDVPIAENINDTVEYESSKYGALPKTDNDGDTLIYSIVEDVKNGSITLSQNGEYTYQPNPSFSGIDSFIYQATDSSQSSAEAMVTFKVNKKPVSEPTPSSSNTSESSGGSFNKLLMFLLIGIFGIRQLIAREAAN